MAALPARRTSVGVELGTAARPTLIRWSNGAARWGSQEAVSYALLTGKDPVLIDLEEPTPDEAKSGFRTLIDHGRKVVSSGSRSGPGCVGDTHCRRPGRSRCRLQGEP